MTDATLDAATGEFVIGTRPFAPVGYRLRVIETGEVIDQWGGTWGVFVATPPAEIRLPSGDIVCAPVVGDDYQGCVLEVWEMEEPPPPPPAVPQLISDRQFFQQAAVLTIITQAEALAAVQTGVIPAILQTVVDGISDPDQKFAATMLLSGATVFERNHPFTEAVGAALGWTSEQIDAFFMAAAQL